MSDFFFGYLSMGLFKSPSKRRKNYIEEKISIDIPSLKINEIENTSILFCKEILNFESLDRIKNETLYFDECCFENLKVKENSNSLNIIEIHEDDEFDYEYQVNNGNKRKIKSSEGLEIEIGKKLISKKFKKRTKNN